MRVRHLLRRVESETRDGLCGNPLRVVSEWPRLELILLEADLKVDEHARN